MSTVYIIKDGIIVDKLIAHSGYRDSRGITVKPNSQRKEKELIQYSENNKKIKELKEKLEKFKGDGTVTHLQKELAAQASLIQREQDDFDREEARRELSIASLQNNVLEKMKYIRRQKEQLEELLFWVNTSQGEEQVEAEVDLRTKGALTRLMNRIEEVSEGVLKGDEEELQKLSEEVEQMEQEILSLPEKAGEVFTAQIWRQEQAERVAEQLQASAWQITQVSEGDGLFDPFYLAVENVVGDKAILTFSIQGDVTIDSKFADEERRKAFQQAVLGILVEGGAKEAKGHCMDGEGVCEKSSEEPENSVSKEELDLEEEKMTAHAQRGRKEKVMSMERK